MSVNVIKEYVDFAEKNINTYSKIILGNKYEKYLVKEMIEAYMKAYYYGQSEELSVKRYLSNKVSELKDETLYYNEDIDLHYKAVRMAIDLDQMTNITEGLITKIDEFRKIELKIEEPVKKIGLTDKWHNALNSRKDFFKCFETDDFMMEYNNTNQLNVQQVKIKHNIKFSDLYSEVAIRKAFNRDLVNEQKMFVLYYLISMKIIDDIYKRKIKNEYLLDFDYTIFEKKKKSKRLLDIIENEIAKEKLHFLLSYSDYLKYKEEITQMIKEGYQFAIVIDDKYENSVANELRIKIFSYIIITEEKYLFKEFKTKQNIVII